MIVVLALLPLVALGTTWLVRRRAERNHLATVRALMNAVDAGDSLTRGHSRRVSVMCVAVGRRLGLRGRAIEELECAALLHDLGRSALQREILDKPGSLDPSERHALRAHAEVAHAWLRSMGFYPRAAEIVRAHHERMDGTGYPRGLTAKRIPLGSRIIMAVAAFDAMTSDRPYRRGLSPDAAFEELLANSGSQFFPDVVEAIIDLYASGGLLAGFAPEELEAYARGDYGSRAVEAHIARIGFEPSQKDATADGGDFGIPMLAMLPLPGDTSAQKAEFALSPDRGLKLVSAALSDAGCTRLDNEDAFGMFGDDARGPGTLFLVADGLGGHAAGEMASRLAVEMMQGTYFTAVAGCGMGAALAEALGAADAAVRAAADEGPSTLGMGTTCTAAAIDGHALVVGHVGDSRAYLVALEGLVRLTTDHTLAGEFERVAGAEGLAGSAHVLTRCLGGGAELKCDVSHDAIPLLEGDAIVLCTDGLSGVVDDEEIESVVRQRAPADACRFLVETARERGGPDNITVLVARVERA
jgi:serine/threonine protein phosphatase PrpC